MKSTVIISFLTLLSVVLASPAPAADAQKIVDQLRAATLPGEDMRSRVEFIMTSGDGKKITWSGQVFRTNVAEPKIRIAFDQPADMKGVEFAARQVEDDLDKMKFYLPALRRQQSVRMEMLGTSFLGTDFTYETLGLEEMDFYRHELAGEAEHEGRKVWKIVSKPDEERLWYGKIVRHVDQKTHLPIRTEYYDRAGLLFRLRTIDEIKTIEGHPTPMAVTMTTKPEKTSTTLRFSKVEYDTAFEPSLVDIQGGKERPASS